MQGNYINPVVVATPPSKVSPWGWHPITARVRNITSTGFEIRVQEWDYLDGTHGEESIGYMVFEAGEYTLPNGAKLVAGNTVLDLDTNNTWKTIDLNGFETKPVVFSHVSTNSDANSVTTRHQNVSTTGFEIRLQEEEAADQIHGEEKIGWIAVEPGLGEGFEVGSILARQSVKTISFINTYSDHPTFVASMQTYNGADPASVRRPSLDATSASVIVEEDQSVDSEVSHSYESVGYWVIEPGLIGADSRVVPTRTFEFDSQGRMVAVELPAVTDPSTAGVSRPRYEYGYDTRGQQDLIIDPNGHETRFVFNDLGQQVERQLPLHFGLDGIEGTADDAAATPFSESFEYDVRGRRVLQISFEGVHTQNVYDDVTGRMTEIRYFKDAATYNGGAGTPNEQRTFTYDDEGRVVEVKHFEGPTEVRSEVTTYTDDGQIESITNNEGVIRYSYDEFGRQTEVAFYGREFTPQNSNDFDTVTQYSYDELGRLKTVSVVERGDVLIDVDPLTAGDQPEETSYSYDLVGNLDQVVYSNVDPDKGGLVHDYGYDSLNRLTSLYHWVDENSNGIRDGENETKASFKYTLRADGKRIAALETFRNTAGTGPLLNVENTYTWQYDDAGRLISEELDSSDDTLDYQDSFSWDLTGNRLETTRDWGDDGANNDYTTTYVYDSNDRLETETKVYVNPNVSDEVTTYGYSFTQQRSKSVMVGTVLSTTQLFEYDLQGRMSVVKKSTNDTNGALLTYTETSYEYDSAGNRVATEVGVSNDGDTDIDSTTRVEYLTDSQNHTGYSQVLQETEFDNAGNPVKKTVYVIGHDQISQTVYNWDGVASDWDAGETHHFGTDGHGSVRVLYDALALIVADASQSPEVAQLYHYDAFGNLLNFANGVTPLTSYLYSGEAFDFNIGQQYLRARFYDPVTGRFNRLDPFAGNSQDPQSFHKYAYVHGDPIMGVDPTGMWFREVIDWSVTALSLRAKDIQRGLQGLNSAKQIQRVMKIYNKAFKLLDKGIEAYESYKDIMDMLSIDLSDLEVIRNRVVGGGLKNLVAGAPLISIKVPFPDRVVNQFKWVRQIAFKMIGNSRNVQAFMGEMATAAIAYALGFEQQNNLDWVRSNNGPDQIARMHADATQGFLKHGFYGVFEAKGGSSKLGYSKGYGGQMSGEWITYWMEQIIRQNRGNAEGRNLRKAYRAGHPMLAVVSSFNMKNIAGGTVSDPRVSLDYHIGFQIYTPGSDKPTRKSWGSPFI